MLDPSSTPLTPTAEAATRRASRVGPLLFVLAIALVLRLIALMLAADLIRLPGDEGYYVETARAIQAQGHHPGSSFA
jgi:hypothetical protein